MCIYNHKWCVHSILPLGFEWSGSSFLHMRRDNASDHFAMATPNHSTHWAVELARFPLAAGGGKRSVLNVLELFLFSFVLCLRQGGGTSCRPNVIRNGYKCYGTLREPTMTICIGVFRKPCLYQFARNEVWSNCFGFWYVFIERKITNLEEGWFHIPPLLFTYICLVSTSCNFSNILKYSLIRNV
jgi:hypothetical protein